jgi:hypothetical protein
MLRYAVLVLLTSNGRLYRSVMADFDRHKRRRGIFRGPSEGVKSWAAFWMGIADWLITARIRWREGDPSPTLRRTRLCPVGALGAVAAVVLLGQRLLGG